MVSGSEPSDHDNALDARNPLQRLLAESSADELTRQSAETIRTEKSDLVEMVSQSMAVLSTMAAELGVILRLQVRAEKIGADVDEEKVRRVLNALAIHLLSVSQSAGWVTIGLDENNANGRRGCILRITADHVILPGKTSLEYEEEFNTQAELSLCRKIVEKLGGEVSVRFQDESKLAYSVWFPV